jgi:Holliday junction DNA helicase RuvB
VGLSTLAVAVGEEPETVETVAEPFLVREGLLGRTPRGRVATKATWRHLGLRAPLGAQLTADLQAALLTEAELAADPARPDP